MQQINSNTAGMTTIGAPDAIRHIDIAEAARCIVRADRILVVGCSGGGKSTLSQKIATRFGLDYISVDRDILWLPGWVQRERGEQRRIIERLISAERWIMDGTNPSTFDIRVPRSDLVIWVRMPRYVNVWGILSRWIRHIGRTRPEMAAGCRERMDFEFFRFVWTWEKAFSGRVTNGLLQHGQGTPVLTLKSRRQMRDLLDLLDARA
ncbi:adenylate kinase family enzyme [Neorhizobium alkalisoli]|uniref:Adenylate kinase family enzyme n=2 Tax=Neorhizobium alkalisoli TaxID=528178 RepID=A0A561QHI2_9HYPH|nr:adenylate kinase family enzyme [Neorhizobium alkalisoli]